MSAMWKPSQSRIDRPHPNPEPARPAPLACRTGDPPRARPIPTAGDQATIGKGLVIKGEITGSEVAFYRRQGRGQHHLPDSA